MSIALFIIIIVMLLVWLNIAFWLGVWFWNGKTQNNPLLAWFLVDDGTETKHRKGQAVDKGNSKGITYVFYDGTKTPDTITVPHDYGFTYWKHRRRIDIGIDNRLQYKNSNAPAQDKYNELIRELTLGHIGADIVRAVSSSKLKVGMIIIVAVIALVIGAVGMSVYSQMTKRNTSPPPITTPIPQPPSGIAE